jgi:type VI secretion system protein ImpC
MADAEARAQEAAPEAEVQELGFLDQILTEGRFKTEQEQDRAKGAVQELVREILDETVTYKKDIEATLNEQIARIDELLSAQLNEVLHHPKFKKLEASWRGSGTWFPRPRRVPCSRSRS